VKAVILAGGMGTRISEETIVRPKPMIEIGGRPILWHIMKLYAHHGLTDFVICLGYKGYMIKEYFMNFVLHHSDVTIDATKNSVTYHQSSVEPWRITLVDTGETTLTGGRLRRVRNYLDPSEPFCFTYGDGLSDVDIGATIAFHRNNGKLATVTAVRPPGRYGALEMDGPIVKSFVEKPAGDNAYINGGFFVLDPAVIDRIEGDRTAWELAPLEGLARDAQLCAYPHHGFLAADGHASRKDDARRSLAVRPRAVAALELDAAAMNGTVSFGLLLGLVSFVLGWILHFIIWRIKRPEAYPIWVPLILFLGLAVATTVYLTNFGSATFTENVEVLASALLLHAVLTVGYMMGYAGIIEYSPSAEVLYAVASYPDGVSESELNVPTVTDEFLVGKRLSHLVSAGMVREHNDRFSIEPVGRFIVKFTIVYRRMLFEQPFGEG